MRWRPLLLGPVIALSVVNATCPLGDEAPATAAARRPLAPMTPESPAAPPELTRDAPEDLADLPEDDPEPEPIPSSGIFELASIARETWVLAEPLWNARRLGYLRAGAVVSRRAEPARRGGLTCSEGWYRVEPKGYVCVGAFATLDVSHAVVKAASRRPRRDGLPYAYVMSRSPPPLLYARLPSAGEALRVEPDLDRHLRWWTARAPLDPAYVAPPPAEPLPEALRDGRAAPALGDAGKRPPDALDLGRAVARSGFALLSTFDHEGRRYGLTTELAVLPIDRTRVVRQSTFAGLALDDEVTLPVAFVRDKHAHRYAIGPKGGLTRREALAFRQAVPVTSGRRTVGGEVYFEAKDGSLIKAREAVRVDPAQPPASAASGQKWIDVSILRQSLVAYEGTKPVYVTLVSTGRDGIRNPRKTRSTIQGTFLIQAKHVSVTMDEERKADRFDFRDVPFVQYFTEGFALHGAYWHDDFGTPRSHGCINLAPLDAAWLFNWTDPEVPAAWHAATLARKSGTLVHTHP